MACVSKQEIDLMNKILITAVDHGGDDGGPYGTKTDELLEVVYEWIKSKRLETYEAVVTQDCHGCCFDRYVQIVKKANLKEAAQPPAFYAC